MLSTQFTRMRGDTYPITLSFPKETTIDGWAATLSVSKLESPAAPVTYELQIDAEIDPLNRKAVFRFSEEKVNLVGKFFYDIEVNAAGVIYTVAKGRIEFLQDITK